MELKIDHGSPADMRGRLPKEVRAYALLDSLGIDYMRADHEALPTIEACQKVDEALGTSMCKNLFLCNQQKTKFYLLLMPGRKLFKTKYLSSQIGSGRLSFAGEEKLEELMGLTPGSVTVLGLMNDREGRVQLLIDRDLLTGERFGCHPCINTASVAFTVEELTKKLIPALSHEPIYVELPWTEAEKGAVQGGGMGSTEPGPKPSGPQAGAAKGGMV